ncbi:hypothetical protein Q1695_015812 [Nippostrongylus brasiliensis]|nr:hypothetical protein Q1695_015812 [Nippostrongylus brasiliensis]
MVKIAILLLLATSCTAFEDVRNIYREQANEIFKKQGSECVNVDEREQIRMPEFLDAHKGLNLVSDTDILEFKRGYDSVGKMVFDYLTHLHLP